MYNNYPQNGVILVPSVVAEGDNATVTYKGLLMKSGADSVYMRVGFGDDWRNTRDIKMSRSDEGFRATLPITQYDQLHLVFKDSAGNWDNNSGRNYSFEVQAR